MARQNHLVSSCAISFLGSLCCADHAGVGQWLRTFRALAVDLRGNRSGINLRQVAMSPACRVCGALPLWFALIGCLRGVGMARFGWVHGCLLLLWFWDFGFAQDGRRRRFADSGEWPSTFSLAWCAGAWLVEGIGEPLAERSCGGGTVVGFGMSLAGEDGSRHRFRVRR